MAPSAILEATAAPPALDELCINTLRFLAVDMVQKANSGPKRFALLPHADHFFTGQLEPMQSSLAGWLKEPACGVITSPTR